MSEKMTRKRYNMLIAELDDLRLNKREDIAKRLKAARSLGNLSENAEYLEIRKEWLALEERITQLQ